MTITNAGPAQPTPGGTGPTPVPDRAISHIAELVESDHATRRRLAAAAEALAGVIAAETLREGQTLAASALLHLTRSGPPRETPDDRP
ncbi:hypothetical protein [Parafrankia discariae]|uniref:hypothetical protein n=1 Tax=Parafrankia discariae TaxID=365528 RepID=UPI0003605213|nr:hypothetical protein [Parafrankia discariae]